jgi:hypothetical protein
VRTNGALKGIEMQEGDMEIQLQSQSVVNERTGEVETPNEFVENLRQVERLIAAKDDEIDGLKTVLKAAREERENLVGQLRQCVREGKVLPLIEATAAEKQAEGDAEDDAA